MGLPPREGIRYLPARRAPPCLPRVVMRYAKALPRPMVEQRALTPWPVALEELVNTSYTHTSHAPIPRAHPTRTSHAQPHPRPTPPSTPLTPSTQLTPLTPLDPSQPRRPYALQDPKAAPFEAAPLSLSRAHETAKQVGGLKKNDERKKDGVGPLFSRWRRPLCFLFLPTRFDFPLFRESAGAG